MRTWKQASAQKPLDGAAFLSASVGSLVLSDVLGLPIVVLWPESWGSGPPPRCTLRRGAQR